MFNPAVYANSHSGGYGVLQVTPRDVAPEESQRFIPLQQTTLTGDVYGPLAALQISQHFAFSRSEHDGIVEAAYRFPLPGDAAVRGVHVRFGAVEIEASLEPRATAEAAYAEAKEEGRQAALLTREAPDVFTLQVAGIPPDTPMEIATDFVQLAQAEGLEWLLRIPLTTAPRYVREDDLKTAHAQGQPLTVLRDPGHRFRMDVTIHAAGAVRSPTHALNLDHAAETTRVQLADGAVLPDRDCVLVWTPTQAEARATLTVFTQSDATHTYFLALVAPPAAVAPEAVLPREVIVLLDHSGSMTGPKWEAADWAVERFLGDLHQTDLFDLCLFHTTTAWFATAPRAADAPVVAEAVSWLKSRRDSGGTNLGVALEEALALPRGNGDADGARVRNVLIVTDAAVTDAGRILRLADQEAAHEDRRRLNVLCIDAAPNAFLANELAARGGGISAFLTSRPDAEDITTALERVLAVWSAPVATDLSIAVDAPGLEGALGPARARPDAAALDLGDLPAQQARWVAGRVPRTEDGMPPMRLMQAGRTVAREPAAVVHVTDALKPLFGVRRVNALEFLLTARYDDAQLAAQLQRLGYDPAEVLAESTAAVYAENTAQRTADALRALLVAESMHYGLLSSVTGFVAVRKEQGHKVDRQVIVANALPEGWSEQFLGGPGAVAAKGMLRSAVRSSGHGPQGFGNFPSAQGMPMMAAMPAPAASGVSAGAGGLGGPKPTWRDLFTGRLPSGEAVTLYASTEAESPSEHGELISGLRLTVEGDAPAAADVTGVTLLIYVDDMALPRARVRLADLLRTPERPLNLLRRPGAPVRLVLADPDARLRDHHVRVTIAIETRKERAK